MNKKLSKYDEHDIWYYNFIKSGNEYDIQIDTNEADGNIITSFVNFRMESEDGKLLGVIGVGLEISDIEGIVRSYEQNYNLSVYIVNVRGSENSFGKDTDVFVSEEELARRTGIQNKILNDFSTEPLMRWFTSPNERKCIITKYDETLGWYLVLEKDTISINRSFQKGIMDNIIFMLISLAACIMVTTAVFLNFNHRTIEMENTDELTGLPNSKLFYRKYRSFVRKCHERRKTIFMFDIDKFKEINDTQGHLFGNEVLAKVGESLKKTVEGHGIAARWGGDEFIGALDAGSQEAEEILRGFMEGLRNFEKENGYIVTVSVGIAEIHKPFSGEQLIQMVDEAVYISKQNGRNRITIYKPNH